MLGIPSSRALLFAASVAIVYPYHAAAATITTRQASNVVNTKSLQGLFLFGYQGFFRRPGQGNDHYMSTFGETPGPSTPGDVQFDMFPAVDEYPAECLFDSDFILPSGAQAQLFESNCTGVVDKHFQWMQATGIDGILVQRFYKDIGDASFLQLLAQVRTAAEKYGRGFAVEYDLSQINQDASNPDPDAAQILFDDYEANIRPLMDSPAYLQHEGRPVIELWGIGIAKSLGAAQAQDVFTTLRSANPNPYVIMGVQQAWRADANDNPDYYAVYLEADVIQPWTVGSYDFDSYDGFYSGTTVPDKAKTDSLGIKYSPVVWPGGSSRNRQAVPDQPVLPLGDRHNGTFYEDQLSSVIQIKPFFIFGAMFDEYPEGTQAIATLRFNEVPPDPNPGFLGIDNAFDHNYYLDMAGSYAQKLHELWA